LDKLLTDAGASKVSFDNIVPMVRAKQSIVAAGATYEADLFISASSSSFVPEMYKDGQKLELFDDPSGVKMGKVKFVASGGGYDKDGIAKKTFKTEIKLPDTTLTQIIEYQVAQPTIKVTTGNAPTLYMNCGNNVTIEVPALGSNYNPSFSANGAEVRKGDKPGKVTIIPSQRKISVNVANGGTSIGATNFDVKNVPEPRFVAMIGNTPVDLRQGIKANQLRSLRILVEADENFKEEVPKDARYNIREMEVTMGSGPVAKATQRASNGNPDLAAWQNQARPGDRIIFVVKDAVRKTFTDKDEKVPIKGSNGVIQVNIN
jgi:gliding motility-associated protein GldM